MGMLNGGLHGMPSGEVGGLIYYQRMGKTVCRIKGVRKKGSSPKQLANESKMGLISTFITPVLEFVTLGYKAQALKEGRLAYNMVTSELKLNGWKGVFPDVVLDYERMVLSKGDLPVAEQVSVELVPTGIEFKWHVDPDMRWLESTDQAMLLVYIPEIQESFSVLYGSERALGSCILPVSEPLHDKTMHTFISFISADRTGVSNGIYAGGLNL